MRLRIEAPREGHRSEAVNVQAAMYAFAMAAMFTVIVALVMDVFEGPR